MNAKHFITYPVLFLAAAMLFSFCEEGVSEDVAPLKWTSSTHQVKKKNKYTHEVVIDASADTIHFKYIDNYFHLKPYVKCLKYQKNSIEYDICHDSATEDSLIKSNYLVKTHEQHISNSEIKIDLKDNAITVSIAANTSAEQKTYSMTFNDSKYGGGCPSLGYILIIQKGKSK